MTVRTTLQHKIKAYKTLWDQTSGTGSRSRPTPSQIQSFSKWIDKGACVHNVSFTQLNRWSGKPKNWTVGTAKTTLTSKFGKPYIKAVACNKSGGFIVATSPTRKGRTFKFTS